MHEYTEIALLLLALLAESLNLRLTLQTRQLQKEIDRLDSEYLKLLAEAEAAEGQFADRR